MQKYEAVSGKNRSTMSDMRKRCRDPEEDITAVRIIRNVNLCHGRSRRKKSVHSVVDIWLKREISLYVQMSSVVM